MQQYNTTKILAITVIGIGAIVIIGWFFDIQVLKSISNSFVTMKLSTAISFVMSGLIIYLMNEIKQKNSSYAKIFLAAPIIVIIFFMVTLLVSSISGIRTGLEDIFIKETEAVKSVTSGRPSIATMTSFILVVIVSLVFTFNPLKNKPFFIIGSMIIAISSMSLIGYATDLSFLYYEIEGVSTAMALHTSIAFIITGTSMILLSQHNLIQQHSNKRLSLRRQIGIIVFTGTLPIVFFATALEYAKNQQIVFEIPLMVAITAFALITTIFISKLIVTPLKALTKQIMTVSIEEEEEEEESKTEQEKDELTQLVTSFETMKIRIKEASEALHQSEQKFKALYENSPDLYRSINLDGIILECNSAYAKHLGYEKSEIIGTSIFDYVPPESLDAMHKTFQNWKKTGLVVNMDIILRRKDGSTFPALLSANNLFDKNGNVIGSNTIIRDISEIRDAQKMINELRTKRLSVVGELSSRLAHDLRNPLSVIKNSVELLKIQLDTKYDTKTDEHFNRIDRSVSRMIHQIEHVMDFVRMKPLVLKKAVLDDILESAIGVIDIPDGIKINQHQTNITLICDPDLLQIVFINLITNAIQVLQDLGQININLTENANDVIIECQDSGPGIPDDELPKIFDPLFTTKQSGTGLGLASCKTIVEQHGGTISTMNNPTRFIIKLPKKA